MIQKINIDGLSCVCCANGNNRKIAYILYPMDILDDWIEGATEKYGVTIVVITGMDWQNVFSPWPAPGVPKGTPDFKGESPEFLAKLQNTVIPTVESKLEMTDAPERTLVGVSMSGLFALWQWMLCDTFQNIGSLSGSFWYEGFVDWMKGRSIPKKPGRGYFLLGDLEPKSKVKAFSEVGIDTQDVLTLLRDAGINVEFESVPGDHFANPIPRLNKAFEALY